jgi:hypothetical protein
VVAQELRAIAVVHLVVLVDLHVDPRDVVLRPRVPDLLGDVDDGAADAALAQRGRREEEHDRALSVGVREVHVVHVVGRLAGVDLRQIAADGFFRRRVDHRRPVADLRDVGLLHDADRGAGSEEAVVEPEEAEHQVLARLLERDV